MSYSNFCLLPSMEINDVEESDMNQHDISTYFYNKNRKDDSDNSLSYKRLLINKKKSLNTILTFIENPQRFSSFPGTFRIVKAVSVKKDSNDISILVKPRDAEESDVSLYQKDFSENLSSKSIEEKRKSLIEQAKKIKEKRRTWIRNLFGEMRDLTDEEQKNYKKSLLKMSEPTGENFWD